MRIRELFEGGFFKDSDFTTAKDGGREINFDIVDDLAHFMDQDDHAYRRHTHPCITKFVELKNSKKDPKPGIFEPAVKECYKLYIKKFPIRELPDKMDEETCNQVCEKLYNDHSEHHSAGKYKD